MENNFSDKQMRDKLKGIEAPYDPHAWEQMEVMLDEKKKRRGFFWWWFGGAAASMLLVAGVLGYQQFTAHSSQFAEKTIPSTVHSLPAGQAGLPSSANTIPSAVQGLPAGEAGPQSTINNKQPGINTNTQPLAKNKSETGGVPSLNSQTTDNKQQSATSNHSTYPKQNTVKSNHRKSTGINKQVPNLSSKMSSAAVNETANIKSSNEAGPVVTENANQPTEFPSTKNTGQEAPETVDRQPSAEIYLEPVQATLLKDAPDNKMEKKDENTVLPKRKKIFNYSLGVIANVTGTITSLRYTPEFSKQPSYAIGLTHEFMFWKRFAITNGIAFSQTSFSVQDPTTVHYFQAPRSYTSNITELDIPIGIKVCPVSKEKIRFYVQAGIINHIKLKESFSYEAYRQDTFASYTASIAGNSVYPAQTNFSGGSTFDPVTYSTASAAMKSSGGTSDFSINNSKRYYASFYASAGIDYIVKKHFVFFTEPLFYMSLEKIGVQNERKYNLGLSGGFRYQF